MAYYPALIRKRGQNDDAAGLGVLRLTDEQLAYASHAVEFDAPIYNVWKQQSKTAGSKHFGNSEVRWVDNLLYLYTRPFTWPATWAFSRIRFVGRLAGHPVGRQPLRIACSSMAFSLPSSLPRN